MQSESAPVVDAARLMSKLTLRLIPFLCLCFLAAFLDRVNVGFAALEMQADLKFSNTVYSLGAGLFFVGYALFEVPSNLVLERVGARLWIARIMLVWGALSSAMMFVTSVESFYVLRFLLGAAEAGFFPGIILYLTYFFPATQRSRSIALFMTAPALSGIVGSPLSGYLLDHHPASFRGWQWLFLVEGLPSIALGALVPFVLPDGPRSAKFLTAGEREWLERRLAAERREREARHVLGVWQALYHPRVLLLSAIYFLVVMGAYGFDFFMPKLFATVFPGVSKTTLGLLAAVPPLTSVFVMIAWGHRSDRLRERRRHVAWPAVWAAAGLFLASFPISPAVALFAASVAVCGRWSCIPPFWGLPTAFLSGSAAASGIALINALGNLGGFVGPMVMGGLVDLTGSYSAGLRALAVAYLLGAVLVLRLERAENVTETHAG